MIGLNDRFERIGAQLTSLRKQVAAIKPALDQLRERPHDPVETLLPKSVTPELLAETYIRAETEAATTPGTVVGKVEVFDADGNSLGFLPIYDGIA